MDLILNLRSMTKLEGYSSVDEVHHAKNIEDKTQFES
jgi:hypothetical protein